jgi:Ca2+-binding EF-hand superfamily protein
MIIQERNILSQAKEKSSRARWHYHKSLQRKLFTLFFTHVLQQRVVHAKWKKTIAHHKFAQCRRYFVSWYKATYTTISEKKIDEMKSILHYFNRLQVHRLVQIQKHKAEVHLLVRLRRKAWVELKQLRSEGKHNASIAQAHYDEVLIEKAWQAFKQRVLLLKNADNLHRYHSQKKIIHQWIERKAYSFYDKKVTALGATFRRKKLLKQQFGVWHLRAQWKIQERRLFALAKENYLRHCFKHAIALWDRRKNVLLDLKLINQIATDFRYFKLIQLGYEEAFFLQWSITVGKKRIAMAIRIQKVYRGNRGRKKARQKRMLVQYQMERRIGSEADAKDISVEQLFRSFKTQVWSFSFLYFPWEPADKFQRKCFAKLATAFSMRSKTVHFGFLDVTQVAKTSFGRGLSGASQTSVLSQFSLVPEQVCSVIAFWQGRGHLTMPSKSKYRRRFKAICSSQKDLLFSIGAPASLPLYVSSKEVEIVSYKTSRVFDKLAVWTEDLIRRSRQATAIDLQSYVRGWLARKRLPQIKQKHKERIGKKLASWIKKMYIRKKTRRNNCAALKIQRWYTQSMIRIRFWINLRVSMNHYRNSALKLQRSLRAYICRLHTFRAIERYTATPSKYMNAPLCVECLDEDKEVYQVANLKCRDCDDLFCTSCFFKLHKTGKRLKHLVDLIDFKALHENSRIMCFVCEVEKATRICLSCACISGGFGSDASKIDQLRKTLRTPAPLPSNQVAEIKPKRLSLWSNRFSRKSVAFATDTGSKLSTASTKPSDIIPVENIAAACLCATCHDKKHIIRVERHVTLKKYTPYVKPPRRYIDQPIHKDTHQWMRMTDIYASGTIVISSLLAILGGKQVVEKRRYVTLLKVYAKKSDGNARKLKEYQRAAAISAFRDENESVIREAFDRYDQDKSGWIDRDELQCMFREELCQPLTEEELLKVLEAIDKSKNGHIEFEELLLWFSEELYNKSQNPNQAEPRKIQLLKETLRAKRQMRRYKERLEHQIDKLPSVPSPMVLLPTFPPKPKLVPGFPSVLQLETKDFETKKKVFFRFLHEICGIEWIFEDESLFSKEKAIETFEKVFLPRWNTGVLTYDFYFDDESFEHDGSKWTRKWIPKQKRYVYCSRRKKMIVKTQNKSSKKKRLMRREKSSSSLVSKIEDTVEEIEVEEDIEELIDPRRKEMLKQEARKAFDLADVDHSGFIDKDEFYNALRVELCEPISRQKALQVMDILDTNKSGTIDFDEFFQWFASEKCQDYQITSNVKRARAILKTRKTLRQTLKMIVTCILQGGKVINELITEKIKEERFKIDAKNASPQLIELLVEGFRKDLSMKALKLYQDNVQVAKEWLQDKIDEEEKKLEEKREMIRQMREIRRQKAKKRQEKLEKIYDKIKSSLVRKNKHLIQRERLQDILNNLDLEIQQVEEDMFKHRSQK